MADTALSVLGRKVVLKLRRFALPLFLLSLVAVLGILLAAWLPALPLWLWLAASVLSLAASWKWRGPHWLLLATGIAFGFHYRVADLSQLRSHLEQAEGGMMRMAVVGQIDTEVEADPSQHAAWRFGLRVETVDGLPWTGLRLAVQLRSEAAPSYGDRVRLAGVARATPEIRNPGEFAYADYLRHEGFAGELKVPKQEEITIVEKEAGSRLYRAALRSRAWLGAAVTHGIADDAMLASTIRAMVLGTQESTPQEVEEAFVNSGTMHIFAVSGLHVVLFGWVLWHFLSLLRLPRGWKLGIIIPLMFFFVFITGLRSSAWRAAIMAALMLSGPLLGRRSDLYNSLGTAALALLMWDPHQVFQAGFQLSFGVLFSLAVLTQCFLKPLSRFKDGDPFLPSILVTPWQQNWLFIKRKTVECLAVSLASTLGCAPLMIAHFGLLTPIGVVANLFLIFISTMILATACVSIVTALLGLKWLTVLANHTDYALALAAVSLATFFASIPYGHFFVNPKVWLPSETARLCVLDLPNGGGAASWLEPKAAWLLDCGTSGAWTRTVRPHLMRNKVTQLDGLFLSHRDIDHNGASTAVRRFLQPKVVYTGPKETPETKLVPTDVAVYTGFSSALTPETTLEVLYPHETTPYGLADDRCSVVLVKHAGWRILFQFDTGFVAEKWMLEHRTDLRADVLVKGNCGHDHSGLPEFLLRVQPRAIISTHAEFPMAERIPEAWRQMVATLGIPLFDQKETGAVDLSFRGQSLVIQSFLTRQRLELSRED